MVRIIHLVRCVHATSAAAAAAAAGAVFSRRISDDAVVEWFAFCRQNIACVRRPSVCQCRLVAVHSEETRKENVTRMSAHLATCTVMLYTNCAVLAILASVSLGSPLDFRRVSAIPAALPPITDECEFI